jgi:2-polyprenyl-3-methyl-5-hydroxy-6-metoxy-1,4-benzoquinol methylase
MAEPTWQLQLFKRSIKKKDKVVLLEKNLSLQPTDKVLDLGCAQGLLSYILKQKGGFWIHADLDYQNLLSARSLLPENLVQTDSHELPFNSASFDAVLCLDYLEHVEDDDYCLAEINRVLGPQGQLILAVPQTGPFFLLHKLRPLLGLKLADYGHKREGYRLAELQEKLTRQGFEIKKHASFSKFFSELIELLLNFAYLKILAPQTKTQLRDGHIRPMSDEEFARQKKSFRLYSLIYPLLWGISRLDKLLFFLRGYSLVVWATKVSTSRSAGI